MGILEALTNRRRVLRYRIVFGAGNIVGVHIQPYVPKIPGSDYIRLWASHEAKMIYNLGFPGNPCASRMIPLESPVPEIGPPGSESGGRKRAHGNRPAARLRKHRMSHRPPTGYVPPLDSTPLRLKPRLGEFRFNPRPRMGGDDDMAKIVDWYFKFQSTPPHGGRQGPTLTVTTLKIVSIHAPARGATPEYRETVNARKRFNPRPRMGGDEHREAVGARL